MTMDGTVRALTDLSEIDRQLADNAALNGAALAKLERRREALRKSIPASPLESYDALGRAGRRPALIELRNAHCGGCYLRLPPQIHSRIRRRESLGSCPHCRRLLYWPEPGKGDGEPAPSLPGAPPAPKGPKKVSRRTGLAAPAARADRRRKVPNRPAQAVGRKPRGLPSLAAKKPRRRLYQS